MNRFFVDPSAIVGDRVAFDRAQSHQIHNVLRLHAGAEVMVLDDQGWQYRVLLINREDGIAWGRVLSRSQAVAEPQVSLTLFQGFLKRDKFEWILQKGTEVGIHCFVPVVTERSLVRKAEMKANRLSRWQSIVREAAEQCGRGRVPRILEPVTFAESCNLSSDYDCSLMAALQETSRSLSQAVGQRKKTGALWIGPEGGFSDAELVQASDAGIKSVCLGPRILRTETAAVVGSALWLYQWGQMSPLEE